ncbi:MAG: DRTGG domain-containing protein [Spirochaetia bacterium]
MDMNRLARKINARHFPPEGEHRKEVSSIYAADTMSSLIANASPGTLLVTSLNNSQLIRVAELMDAPGLCLVGGAQPSPELIARAREAGAAIMVSPRGLEETRRLLEACLQETKQGGA